MYTLDDTIAAIATPLGVGGIGIVRMSGSEALAIAQRACSGRAGRFRRCTCSRAICIMVMLSIHKRSM